MSTDIYLDVDGVLNAVCVGEPHGWGWQCRSRVEQVNGFPIRWSETLVGRLTALAARDDVRVRWLTTWCSDAPRQLAPALGIAGGETWDVIGAEVMDAPGMGGWWKWRALRDLTDRSERFVWLDDDLDYEPDALAWATEQGALAIAPQIYRGISVDEWTRVEDYCREGR